MARPSTTWWSTPSTRRYRTDRSYAHADLRSDCTARGLLSQSVGMRQEARADALFVRRGDEYVATELTQGPWNPEHQHGGPVCALLAVVVEAALEHDGVEVARALALRVRVGATPDALTHPRRPDESPPRAPEQHTGSALELAGMPVPGFIRALEMDRVVGGLGTGAPAITWYRLRVPVVAGEESSPLARLAAIADFTSGSANFLPVTEWSSINADVTMNVLREPAGEWIAVDAIAHAAGDGIGHSRASFFDTDGFVGSGATTQVVDEVAAPFWKLAALGEVS